MTGRDTILSAVKNNRPSPRPLPVMDYHGFTNNDDLVNRFSHQLHLGGGEFIQLKGATALQQFIDEKKIGDKLVLDMIGGADSLDAMAPDINHLDKLYQVFIEGSLAVAENGAVWVKELSMGSRLLPFITEELFLIIDPRQLVASMHDAYERISKDQTGFGTFIAGPSKTADIEQSLVIGAHGPKRLTVIMVL